MSSPKSDPHSLTLHAVPPAEVEPLLPLLHDALPDIARCRACAADPSHTAYAVRERHMLVGAAVVQRSAEAEILLLAVDTPYRGRGIGQGIVATLIAYARYTNTRLVRVGTGSLSLDNIAFYQKCGFRMSHVRRGYFDDIEPPLTEHGIHLRDMIVFDYLLAP